MHFLVNKNLSYTHGRIESKSSVFFFYSSSVRFEDYWDENNEGHFITSMNGLAQDKSLSYYWLVYDKVKGKLPVGKSQKC